MKIRRFWVCLALLLPGWSWAHGDEDHSHGDEKPAPVSIAAPVQRVQATSEAFELVGALQGERLVIHLDRYATNEPVLGAAVTVEGGPLAATPAVEANGVYTVAAAGLSTPGTHALVFTVEAGGQSDLLTGDMVVAGPTTAPVAAAGVIARPWIAVATSAALVLGLGIWALRRRASDAGARP